jgi:hypothetical protein
MPIHIGTKKFENFDKACNYVRKNMPEVSNPKAYVGAIYQKEERYRK